MNTISTGLYKDIQAVILENDVLKVVVLPEYGSKMASLLYKPLNHELLWQNPNETYTPSRYGDPYPDGEFSGFDEMFPTISRCFYENAPWAGIEMPDHGEVWAIPWQYDIQETRLRLRVNGVRFPYMLEKVLWLEDAIVRTEYSATNTSHADFDYIWSAHPLFNASPGMEFIVPSDMNMIVNSVPGPRLGAYGNTYAFPVGKCDDGTEFNFGVVPEKNESGYQKYFFTGKVTEGWCILYNPHKHLNLGMAFPKDKVPYLGMWLNEGGWDGQYNIAPEPATGGMDRVDFSKMWGTGSVLKAQEGARWFLHLALKEGEKMAALNQEGHFQG